MSGYKNPATMTHDGYTTTVCQWSMLTGIPYQTLRNRLRRGWSIKDTIERKPLKDNRKGTLLSNGKKVCCRCFVEKDADEFSDSANGRRNRDGKCERCRDCDFRSRGEGHRQFKPPILNLTEPQKAYLAGLIDGEGYVGVKRNRTTTADGYYLEAVVSIGMTGSQLFKVKEEFGFGRMQTRQRKNQHHKPCHIWSFGPNPLRSILPLIIPYLRFKRLQAKLVWMHVKMTRRKNRSQADKDKLWRIYWKLRELNHRG